MNYKESFYKDNFFTYLKWRGDLSVKVAPFNEIDALILSEISYMVLDKVVPGLGEEGMISMADAFEKYEHVDSKVPYYELRERLFEAAAKSNRYKDMTLCNYVSRTDLLAHKQFAAMHVNITPTMIFIAFRGTDSTVVGWREDANMSYMMPVPAQQDAVDYVNQTVKGWFTKVWIGGHSKGGNLAVYAGVFCQPHIQKKIVKIYSFDGPGFNRRMVDDPAYQAVKGRIRAFVPEESIVGMLMEHEEDYIVVKSQGSSIMQHEGAHWQVKRDGFVVVDALDKNSKWANDNFRLWLAKVSPEERKHLVNAFFTLFEKAGIEDFTELLEMDTKRAGSLLKAVATIPKEDRELAEKLMKLLIEQGRKS